MTTNSTTNSTRTTTADRTFPISCDTEDCDFEAPARDWPYHGEKGPHSMITPYCPECGRTRDAR
ncbi:hypothetical protein [Halovenus sp. HT40]|uniref:hypothetical protein n=1 Tax=Halovenus sp. HT40 TaxID=3126691 RepID=UPI00300F41F8